MKNVTITSFSSTFNHNCKPKPELDDLSKYYISNQSQNPGYSEILDYK